MRKYLILSLAAVLVAASCTRTYRAIGDTHALEQALKMRGGVADTLKVWGIELVIETADDVYIPAYKGALTYTYAHETEEEVAP